MAKRGVSRPMSDDMQDSQVTRGMTRSQLAAWKKADEVMDRRKMSRAEDERADRALAAKVRRTVK